MRIPVALLLTVWFAPVAAAQDLQITVRMLTDVPGLASQPENRMTMYIKGSKLRIDQGAQTSMIYDSAVGKTWVLLHDNRVYMETPNSPYAAAGQLAPDSAALAALGATPEIRSTGEQQTVAGQKAERFLSVMFLPSTMPGSNEPMALVSEHWLATDPALNASYYAYADRMQKLTGAAGQPTGAWGDAFKRRVPVKTTVVMIAAPADRKVDAAAVLRSPKPTGLKMRATVELQDIRTGVLADSLFAVPRGYTHGSLK